MQRWIVALISFHGLAFSLFPAEHPRPAPEKKHLTILKEIRVEVKEMGAYPGQDFFQQAFFVGEDDDDTNKDIHVSILIRPVEEKEKMTVRVTMMKKDRRNPQARLAGTTREFVCLFRDDNVEIQSADYEEEEIAALVPDILTAIRNKKRLLKILGDSIYRHQFQSLRKWAPKLTGFARAA